MYANRALDKCLRSLSESCAGLIDERLNDGAYLARVRVPVFKNGQLTDSRTQETTDYRKLRHDVANNKRWTDYDAFNASVDIVKNDAGKLRGDGPHDEGPDDFARKQLALFVAQLAKDGGHKSPAALRAALSRFCDHLSDLRHTTYIAPLYNVKGDFTMRLAPNLHVRKATADEYGRIVRLQSVPVREIDTYRRRLKFVLSCSVPGSPSKDALQEAIKTYSLAVSLLKLFKDGYPQFGRVYEVESEHMDAGRIESTQSYYENPTAFKETRMTKNDARRFGEFYRTVVKRIGEDKKRQFVSNAIGRFGMAYVHRNPANKIVDYVISLEAMLMSSPGESTLKLAHRTAALYADTDAERVETWEFMKQAYNFRSGIVHASKERPFKMRSSIVSVEEVELWLHKIAKRSIPRMIGLLGSYKSQDDILGALDRSVYDRKEMRSVRKAWGPKPNHG